MQQKVLKYWKRSHQPWAGGSSPLSLCWGLRLCASMSRSLENAVRWCAAAQIALLDTQWPEALLKLPGCAPETDPLVGKLIFKGLRVRMGASFGSGLIRKPLNTGQLSPTLDRTAPVLRTLSYCVPHCFQKSSGTVHECKGGSCLMGH